MLQSIRDRSQSWFAWVIVIAISALFALWGVGNFAGLGSVEKTVAKVNGEPITGRQLEQQYQTASNQIRQKYGAAANIDAPKLRKSALNRLIEAKVISQGLDRLGFSVSDNQIDEALYSNPAFKVDGQFSMSRFNQLVQNIGLTKHTVKKELASEYLFNQFQAGLFSSEFTLPSEAKQLQSLINQKRSFGYALFKTVHYLNKVNVSSAEIKAYYEHHKHDFYSKEQVKIAYLLLSLDEIAKTQHVTETEANSFYQQNQSAYKSSGKRRISQILIKESATASAAQKAKVQATLNTIEKALKKGEKFTTLVKQYSDDIVSKNNGGDMGWLSMNQPPTALEKTVFNLTKVGELSAPIKTKYGYQIIKLMSIKSPSLIPFPKVKVAIIDRLRAQKAQNIYTNIGDKLSTLTFENPDSLSYAANELKLKIHTSKFFTKQSATGDLGNPKVIKAAFSDNVLLDGNNSDVINLSGNKAIVLRKVVYKKPALRPLSGVSKVIAALLKQKKAKALTLNKAKAVLSALKKGKSGVMLATAYDTLWVQKDNVARTDTKIPSSLLQAIYNEPRPKKGKSINKIDDLSDTGYAVFSLQKVVDTQSSPKRAIYAQGLKQSMTNLLIEQYKAYFKSQASIDIE